MKVTLKCDDIGASQSFTAQVDDVKRRSNYEKLGVEFFSVYTSGLVAYAVKCSTISC
jgi:hypothetical protein